jgi:hypothetical protein
MRAEARLQRSCPITTRQLESLIRLAQVGREGGREGGKKGGNPSWAKITDQQTYPPSILSTQARAKAELRKEVTEDDALDVVEMMQESLEAHISSLPPSLSPLPLGSRQGRAPRGSD